MITFVDIQDKLYEYGAKINAPKDILRIYNQPQPDGTPYILIGVDTYSYIVEERGIEFERRETNNLDVLCYWLMENVVFSLASQYELTHRIAGQDFRKALFSKELELMGRVKFEWKNYKELSINRTLDNAPYRD